MSEPYVSSAYKPILNKAWRIEECKHKIVECMVELNKLLTEMEGKKHINKEDKNKMEELLKDVTTWYEQYKELAKQELYSREGINQILWNGYWSLVREKKKSPNSTDFCFTDEQIKQVDEIKGILEKRVIEIRRGMGRKQTSLTSSSGMSKELQSNLDELSQMEYLIPKSHTEDSEKSSKMVEKGLEQKEKSWLARIKSFIASKIAKSKATTTSSSSIALDNKGKEASKAPQESVYNQSEQMRNVAQDYSKGQAAPKSPANSQKTSSWLSRFRRKDVSSSKPQSGPEPQTKKLSGQDGSSDESPKTKRRL